MKYLLVLALFFLFSADYAYALMAPDFIVNVGSALLGIFGVLFLGLSAVFSIFYRRVKSAYQRFLSFSFSERIGLVAFVLLFLITSGFAFAYHYGQYLRNKHEKEYKEWARVYQETTFDQVEKEAEQVRDEPVIDLAGESDSRQEGLASRTEESLLALPSTEENIPKVKEAGKTREEIRRDFFLQHQSLARQIGNADFAAVLKSGRTDYVILDARENIENEIGHLPGSIHIRFADLMDGRWQELEPEKFYYVFCWSGMRGAEVVDFLRSKNVLAQQLAEGANGWYDYGGIWEGEIKFLDVYTAKKYSYLFSTKELKQKLKEGVIIVDSRNKEDFDKWHYPGSIHISTMATPTSRLDEVYGQLPNGASTIIACDSYVNCFDAKLTAVELERRGYDFLGRFNKVYELR